MVILTTYVDDKNWKIWGGGANKKKVIPKILIDSNILFISYAYN